MLTLEEANRYLLTKDMAMDPLLLEPVLESVNSLQPCLDERYSEATGKLIQTLLLTLYAILQTTRSIQSQSAPSGASRSFRQRELKSQYLGIVSLLQGHDKYGCAEHLIPDPPYEVAHGGLWIAVGNTGG